ncbi:DUF4269 domain-containing protein [Hymenobacter gummosus]|uniref:DUF4269 domain-containing protein n=1 Tax=Hymenobacter gummosus TaxID=1776032 RepID=A0A431U0T7_9BACT|nr:DUF4269 domain-containing protein [Hymenobacter gummosus]RTQ48540.1 DUF4269 domain-containing protein [Hymenobacter gummosus]
MHPWPDIDSLRAGTARQQQAYAALQQLQLLPLLRDFGPVLAGTIPLAVDVAGSDLDVICEVGPAQQARFRALLLAHCGQYPGFRWQQLAVRGQASVLCSFRAAGFDWEIFGQAQPAARQYAVRHLAVEHRVLQLGGEAWRRAVQQLKQQGLKTEPAFAQLLQLGGDAYEALLELETWPDEQLRARMAAARL